MARATEGTKRSVISIFPFQSLEKRRRELAKALDDNERLIEAAVTRGRSDKELKLEADIDKLARVRNVEAYYNNSRLSIVNVK